MRSRYCVLPDISISISCNAIQSASVIKYNMCKPLKWSSTIVKGRIAKARGLQQKEFPGIFVLTIFLWNHLQNMSERSGCLAPSRGHKGGWRQQCRELPSPSDNPEGARAPCQSPMAATSSHFHTKEARLYFTTTSRLDPYLSLHDLTLICQRNL